MFQRFTLVCTILLLSQICIDPNAAADSASAKRKAFGVKRLSVDSTLRVEYFERTAALTEWDSDDTMIGCEMVSLKDNTTLNQLSGLITDEPKPVSFDEIIQLMDHCDNLNTPLKRKQASIFNKQSLNIFSGIFPGTKWCGASNLANSYYDLGTRAELDRCCRKHDLCPVKIRSQESRYNVTNTSKYTRLHCRCDDLFYACLKTVDNPSSGLVGRTYFNLSKRDCFEEDATTGVTTFKNPKKKY